jgi:signal recognition particle subunit SRP68
VEELEPSIRYCQYNLSKSGGATPGGAATAELMEIAGKGPGQDLLQVRIFAALEPLSVPTQQHSNLSLYPLSSTRTSL